MLALLFVTIWFLSMLLVISLLLLLMLAPPQLDPSLTPHKAPQPPLPKIDENACPFEGCQFGTWTARQKVQLFSTWQSGRRPVTEVAEGEVLTAITGIHITIEPSEIQVTAPIPDYSLKPGDIVFGYMNHGEGTFSAWFNGYWVEEFDGSGIEDPKGSGCTHNCSAKLLKPGKTEWWVQMKTKGGLIGWTKETDKFDGKDSLAESQSWFTGEHRLRRDHVC